MKKELSILTLAMAPALSLAAGTAITSTSTLTAAACSLLQDDLRIQLSNGVVGAYNCDTVTTNSISLATCHVSGRVSTRTSNTVADADACSADSANTAACATTTTSASGAVVPEASTQGGSMILNFPGSTCDTAGSAAAGVL